MGDDPIAELRSNARAPFEQAFAMPKSVYISQKFLDRELEDVFKQDWFCAGRASSLANLGDYTTLELAGQQLYGGARLRRRPACPGKCLPAPHVDPAAGQGNTKAIVCLYHAWTYNLDGSLRGAPAMDQNQTFCKNGMKLPNVRCEEWLGWIMVSLNPDAQPVAQALSQVEDLISDYQIETYQETFFETHVWYINWKIPAENFNGILSSTGLPRGHDWRLVQTRRNDLPPGFRPSIIIRS